MKREDLLNHMKEVIRNPTQDIILKVFDVIAQENDRLENVAIENQKSIDTLTSEIDITRRANNKLLTSFGGDLSTVTKTDTIEPKTEETIESEDVELPFSDLFDEDGNLK